jgi:hypothetical protein
MLQATSSTCVEERVAQTVELWRECAAPSVPAAARYSLADQQMREAASDRCISDIERQVRKAPRGTAGRIAMQQQATATFARFAASALDLEPAAIALITDDFLPLGAEFARSARRFESSLPKADAALSMVDTALSLADTALSMADIVQACRNAWTACGLQPLLGERMALTPSILGYSLLYPYSDNYLDQVGVSTEAKLRFSERFRNRLRGDESSPESDRETAIWAAVALIEQQYPRAAFPEVFDSLLAIHQAQEESIAQLCGDQRCNDAEILRISCAKGGTSVLANACLSRGWVDEQEEILSFEMGTLLQLGDDLQDLRDDLKRGSATLFTAAARRGMTLDSLVAQLLNLHERVALRMDSLPHGSPTLKRLLRMSWRSLILGAVAQSHEFFSPEFLRELEATSPLRFAFLRDRGKRLASRKGLYQTLFDAFLEAPEAPTIRTPVPVARRLLYGISQ